MRVGILLPHFGPESNHRRLFDFTPTLEAMGFGSAWVRDQIGFTGGHAFEAQATRFVDPFVTLTAVAARTTTLVVGTATIIPFRHPAVVAQLVGSLAFLAPGRVIIGVGAGTPHKSFEIVGIPYEDRFELIKETAEVLRATAKPNASYNGRFTSLHDVTIDPAPPQDLEIWYGGSSLKSVERALEYGTGWFPGRCPMSVFDAKLSVLRQRAAIADKQMRVGIIPVVSIGPSREAALAKVNVQGLLEEARGRKAWAKAGPFETADDLEGVLIAGTADDVVEALLRFAERGVDELVLDFRLRMDAYEESVAQIAEEVLPKLRLGPAVSASPPS